MSLSSIISTSSGALVSTQYAIAVSNTNVSNASNTAYSRQTYTGEATTSTTALSQGVIQRATSSYLLSASLTAGAASSFAATIDSYLQVYDSALGSTTLGDDLSSLLVDLQTSLTDLASDPTSASAKTSVVYSAQALAEKLNTLSTSLQSQRTQASAEIATSIAKANQGLQDIADLNQKIISQRAAGDDTSSLEDERNAALASLSSLMGVKAYVNAEGRMTVYSAGGEVLVGSAAGSLSYDSPGQVAAGVTYPDAVPGILLNGKDITSSLSGGAIGALIALRDDLLVDEQSQLDAFASMLADQVNAASNLGTAYPPPTTLTGADPLNASDAFSGAGTVRIALVGATGSLVSSVDIDLSSFNTIGDLVAALDAIDGVAASFNDAGELQLRSEASSVGIAVGSLTSDIDGQGFSDFFGFNDIFSGSSGASLGVSERLQSTPGSLGAAVLDESVTLAGARALSSGDADAITALVDALTARLTFPSADGTGAQQASLGGFAASLVANAAALISAAASSAASAEASSDSVQTQLANATGVNLDEEMALLTRLQTQYEANAQMMSTARDLFDVLISMVN